MSKVKTFAVTIRPKNGITDSQIRTFVSYVKRKCEYYFVITEKEEDERHIHSGLVFKKETTTSNVCTEILRLYKELEDDERKVLRNGVKVMYNKDFIDNYMHKGDNTVIIEKNLPESHHLESYFPPPKKARTESYALNHHRTMKSYESLWLEYRAPHVEIHTDVVRDFLFDMQYNKRRIGLLTDTQLFQHSRWFTRWMNKADVCRLDLPPFEKEEGPGRH